MCRQYLSAIILQEVRLGTVEHAYPAVDQHPLPGPVHQAKADRGQMRTFAKQHGGLDKTSPEKKLIEKEELEKMFKLIHRELPANEARAIELRFKHKHNRNEAAKIMGVDPSTVSRYVSVGIKKVRNSVDENKGGNHDNT